MKTLWFTVGLNLLVVGGGAAAAEAATKASPAHGQQVFGRCVACHKIGRAGGGAMGPELNGIVGRKAGADTSYHYSAALQNSKIIWNEVLLTKFLEAPAKTVPGAKMFVSVPAPQDRADVIAFLKQYKSDGSKR